MGEENRQNTRYSEIGRVNCPELCALPGVLDNISLEGCKIHFPVAVVVNLENEYMIKITLSRTPEDNPLQLMCKPMWVSENSGATEVGFSILYSPDDARLREFINYLETINDDDLDIV